MTRCGRVLRAGSVAAVVLSASGCEPASEQLSVPVFDCGDVALTALYAEDGMTLQTPAGSHRLSRVPAASGAKYEGPDATFWEHQGLATVSLGSEKPVECRKRRSD